MAEMVKIATIATGGTWGRLTAWMGEALEAGGLKVELLKAGGEVPEIALRVDSGEADISVTTTFGARAAYHGKGPYSKKLRIQGIAEVQYPLHWFVPMIRSDTGLTSFAELARKRPPLRLCLPAPDLLVAYPVKSVFKLFGVDPYVDIPRWGGKVLTDFPAVPRLVSNREADGVFRENSPLRYDVSQLCDMSFFQLTEEQARKVSEELSIQVETIKAGTYRNQQADLLALDAEGFTLFARGDLPGDQAYRIARAIDRDTRSHYLGASIFYSSRFAVRTGAPLHEGAARYYREQGYLR